MSPEKENINHEANDNLWHDLEKNPDQAITDKEILKSEQAQAILPFLTLDKLANHEKADILSYATESVVMAKNDDFPGGKYFNMLQVEKNVADLANEGDSWENGAISSKLRQARKLFCAALFDACNDKDNNQTKNAIYSSFFTISPNITSYNGLISILELLPIAERASHNPCSKALQLEAVNDEYNFSKNDILTIFKQSSPTKQLALLPALGNLAFISRASSSSTKWLNVLHETLSELEKAPDTKPLVTATIEGILSTYLSSADSRPPLFKEDAKEMMSSFAKNLEYKQQRQIEQDVLHSNFPTLPKDQDLTAIAPGIAATISNRWLIGTISDNKQSLNLLALTDNNDHFGLSKEDAVLLGAAHGSSTRYEINEKLGINLSNIPLAPQIQLLKYMTEADSSRFEKLCDTMHNLDSNLRLKLAENFIAADFGEDFGDSLLEIAKSNHLSSAEKEKIFDTFSSCRESIHDITNLYSGIDDGLFTKQYTRAANERLTDAITVFRQIAETGKAEANLDWAGHAKFDYVSAMEALNYETRSLEIIAGTIHDVATGKKGAFAEVLLSPSPEKDNNLRSRRTIYLLYSPKHGYVQLHTRPLGSQSMSKAKVEHGKDFSSYNTTRSNQGTEASIGFSTNPVVYKTSDGKTIEESFYFPSPFIADPNKKHDPEYNRRNPGIFNMVSAIRLDREGRTLNMAPNHPERSTTAKKGLVSVDLGAIGDDADTPSGKAARLFSVGNMVRSESRNENSSLNHNTNWFDHQRYGTSGDKDDENPSGGFRRIVDYIDETALRWCTEHEPSSSNKHSFKWRRAQLRRTMGTNAMRAAGLAMRLSRPQKKNLA